VSNESWVRKKFINLCSVGVISNSYEKATFTLARPIPEVANDFDYEIQDGPKPSHTVCVGSCISVIPVGLVNSAHQALKDGKRSPTWLIPKQGEQFDLYVESERDQR
jgi:hypothetical protein